MTFYVHFIGGGCELFTVNDFVPGISFVAAVAAMKALGDVAFIRAAI